VKRAIFINSTDDPSLEDLGLFASAGYYTVLVGLDGGVQFLVDAASEFGIDLETSWLVGRTRDEIETGIGAGCSTVLLGEAAPDPLTRAMSHLLARDFADAAAKIERRSHL
jgi:hypothetical protein